LTPCRPVRCAADEGGLCSRFSSTAGTNLEDDADADADWQLEDDGGDKRFQSRNTGMVIQNFELL
jgi:hypothetical protein